MIQAIQQGKEKDCSLTAVINCARLNNKEFEQKFTQELTNVLMLEYINKHPHAAFQFLKEKGYDLKYLPMNFEGAKVRMKKGMAIVCRRKYNENWWLDVTDDWEANGSKPIDINVGKGGHFFCLMQEGEKYRAWDSNTKMTYLVDLDHFYREGVIGKEFFQIR